MESGIRRVLPAVIAIALGIIFSETMKHILSRQYYTLGCVFLIMSSSILWGMRGIHFFCFFRNGKTERLLGLNNENAQLTLYDCIFIVIFAWSILHIIDEVNMLGSGFSSVRLFIFQITNMIVIPINTRIILKSVHNAHLFDSLYCVPNVGNDRGMGKRRNKLAIIVTHAMQAELNLLRMSSFCFLLLAASCIWLFSEKGMIEASILENFLCAIYTLSSMLVLFLLDSMNLHHRVMLDLDIVNERGEDKKSGIVCDSFYVMARQTKRIALGLALLFYSTTFYVMYVLIS